MPLTPLFRRRLLLTTLAPLVAALLIGWLVGLRLIADRVEGQARAKLLSDLAAAKEIYDSELEHLSDQVRQLSRMPQLGQAATRLSPSSLTELLDVATTGMSAGFVTITDRYGQVRYRHGNPGVTGDTLRHLKPVQDALSGKLGRGTLLLSPQQAQLENPELSGQIATPLLPSPRAKADKRSLEERGLFMVAAAPLLDPQGGLGGVILIGQLLNNNEQLVERITRTISPPADTADHGPHQNATLFLQDVRIATTVLDAAGRRATGTRMSAEVAQRVLTQGELWHARAYVLNERYFAAYRPLRDPDGSVVGALYVGLPEQPYRQLRLALNLTFAGLLLALTVLGLYLTGRLTRQLDEREREIQTLNRTLEQKVLERTAQLEESNSQLLAAEKELARTERLAELGMLSAGVAHEINNPLAIIRGNAELLQMALPGGDDSQEEVNEILTQTGRINRIVASLLTLARQEQRASSRFDPATLLDEILDQVGHQIPLDGYRIVRAYLHGQYLVQGDREQLRQVFTNLVINGLQAMDGSGVLAVGVEYGENGCCMLSVADTGPGISLEHQERIFTPFYTTKQNGTGLGLAVTWGIVRHHGGTLELQSEPGCGACFTVRLPVT